MEHSLHAPAGATGAAAGATARRTAAAWIVAAALGGCAAAGPRPPVPPVNAPSGVAIEGYDPVAYFHSGRPVRGRAAYTRELGGVTYVFASPENAERFARAPDRYAPQYGGYCAYAMSLDRIADVDPERWAIVGGKLYLNNNLFAHALWSLDESGRIAAADAHWERYPKSAEDAAR